ncbi:hypothetical protein HHI36_017842 [Cryptolaemus montrouzieri]|uniref:Cytochrome P450 n=1 Tax=Cryptolaemus montrouzieri TaxID=559131 RepID=A0ABD2NNS9_9CUCU
MAIFQTVLFGIFCTLCVWIAKYYWGRRKLYRLSAKIPGPKPYPLIGNTLDFIGDSTEKVLKTFQLYFTTYPDLFKYWLGPKLIFGISKPEHMEIILNQHQCLEKDSNYDFTRIYLGNGLLTAPVHIWKKNRKIINPMFNQKRLDSFIQIFSKQAKTCLEIMKQKAGDKTLDIFPIISACNIDTICETTMGISVNAQKSSNHFGILLDRIMEIVMLKMAIFWYHCDLIFKRTKHQKVLDETLPIVKNFTGKIISAKKKLFDEKTKQIEAGDIIEEDDKSWKPFLDLLLALTIEGKKFSEEELGDEVNTFMAAGSDTTAGSLSFCFMALGIYQDVQKKVYQEVIDVLGEDRDITPEDLPHLHYTERFIKEVLRLFPVVGFIMRTFTADVDIGDAVLPEGSSVLISLFHAHRSPKYWKDPLKFDPDRFLPEESAKRHPYSFLPFSAGPRSCIGKKYAVMNLKSILATVVRKLVIKCDYKSAEEVELKLNIMLRPIHGFKVSVELRE